HVRLLPRDQRQRQACAFPAGETVDALERAVAGEIPLAEEIAERLRRRVRRQVAQVVDRRGARAQRFDRVLGEVADVQVGMRVALAAEQRQFADQRLDQGRLAGAVGAEQTDAVARLQAETDIREDAYR